MDEGDNHTSRHGRGQTRWITSQPELRGGTYQMDKGDNHTSETWKGTNKVDNITTGGTYQMYKGDNHTSQTGMGTNKEDNITTSILARPDAENSLATTYSLDLSSQGTESQLKMTSQPQHVRDTHTRPCRGNAVKVIPGFGPYKEGHKG